MLEPVRSHPAQGKTYHWALWQRVTPILWGLFFISKGEPFWLDMDGFYPLTKISKGEPHETR